MLKAKERARNLLAQLAAAYPERENVAQGMLVALIAREHVFIGGPPGTAKSAMTRDLANAVAGGSCFETLLFKATKPEDILGGYDMDALKEGRYERVLGSGGLLKAFLFLDEIWNGSSTVLQAMHAALNERVFHNGTAGAVPIPLEMVVGASNVYPQDSSLNAMYDRFLFRFWVDDVADREKLRELIENQKPLTEVSIRLQKGDLKELREAAETVPWGAKEATVLEEIVFAIRQEGIRISDRTAIGKAPSAIQAAAVLAGRDKILPQDFLILRDMLWSRHKDRPRISEIVGNLSDPHGSRAAEIMDAARNAARSLPSLDEVAKGIKTKAQAMTEVARARAEATSCLDRVRDVMDDADDAHPRVREAKETVEAALNQISDLNNRLSFLRVRKED